MKHALTYADVQRVKRLAKQLKATAPELPHSRRLDKAAVELCGVRNFHELNRHFNRLINKHVDTPAGPNSVSHCLYCDYRFAADHKPDQKSHRDTHERVMEAEQKLGYRPGTYTERERMKQDGYEQMRRKENEAEGVEGLLMITRSWFDRSLHSAVMDGYWTKHPTFEAYVAMMIPHLETMDSAMAARLAARFGRTPGMISKGQTYWSPRSFSNAAG
ncbi:hypothetical protein AO391_05815 [Pseudomonas marginalis ICMP 9505]|nr:hypothetical protein AO391_05815 [Pseudomonas marginalis ICMP 9505]